MQLKFLSFITGTIFVGLVSGQFPYNNEAPYAGAQASASAQAGGASAQAVAGASNGQPYPPGRQPPILNNPSDGGRFPNQFPGRRRGRPRTSNPGPFMPQRPFRQSPPQNNPYNPANNNQFPQQPNNYGRNNPLNPIYQRQPPQQPNERNNPMNPANYPQPPQQPSNDGRNNPMNPANYPQPFQPPNNNGRNNPMNSINQPQQPYNNERNNPINPANYHPPLQPPNNNGRNNPMNPVNQRQLPQQPNNNERNNPVNPANYPQPPPQPNNNGKNNPPVIGQQHPHRRRRPNGRRRHPNGISHYPRTPTDANREPHIENTEPNTVLPTPIPTEAPKEDIPDDFMTEILKTLGLNINPQSEGPTESNLPPPTSEKIQPPLQTPRRNPYNRRPGHRPFRRRPPFRNRNRKTTIATTVNPLALLEHAFVAKTTPETRVTNSNFSPTTTSGAISSETTIEEKPVTISQTTETSTQSAISKIDEVNDIETEKSLHAYETSSSKTPTKTEPEIITKMEIATEQIMTTVAETISFLKTSEVKKITALPTDAVPATNIIASSSTDIANHSEAIKTDEKATTLPTTEALTSKNTEKISQIQTTKLETTQSSQITVPTTVKIPTKQLTSKSSSDESSVTNPSISQTTSKKSDNLFHIKPDDSEFLPVLLKVPSHDETISTTEAASLPKTTCYCTDGITYVTTENLINIKKATTPLFTAYTKYSEVSNNVATTLSYTNGNSVLTSVAATKQMEDNSGVTKSEAIALTTAAVSQDTALNSGSTKEDSVTEVTSPHTKDLVLTTKPTITSEASATTSEPPTTTTSSMEITNPTYQTTENKDESRTDSGVLAVTSMTFGANYYATAVPPPGVECRENERYYECAPNCRQMCYNYDNYDVPCPDLCIAGCFCDPGLVVDENGKCVKTSECKDYTCKDNEEWWECKPKNRNTCHNFARAEAKQDFDCEPGCFCKEGLIQAPDGSCVKPNNCPEPVCDRTAKEVPTDCVNACHTCAANCRFCEFWLCICGCDCLDGFKRDANGTCIPAMECPVCTSPPPTTTTTIDTTTTATKVETTTPLPKAETTTSVPTAQTTTTAPKDETTTSIPKVETTTSVPKVETTTSVPKVETTTSVPKAVTTSASPKVETTTLPMEDYSTTLLTPKKTSQTLVGTTAKSSYK